MKKITTNGEPFDFRINGEKVLHISAEGVLATDEEAQLLADRLGSNITIVDTSIEEAVAEVAAPTVPEEQPAAEEVVASVAFDAEGVSTATVAFEAPAEEVPAVEEVAPKKRGSKKN